ncbi:heat shock protein HspQ [Candidatus Uabimicrobium sp. HlEnr_7]|uniref:heat shock protein HspQ n=1 Tax=Candidatus Uabimicrobium helgolandensis TaxID=3095367 RepID=UPI003557DA46
MQEINMSQLPYLIKLMDDESPTIRRTIIDKILQLGNEVLDEITKQKIEISKKNYRKLETLFAKKITSLPNIQKQWLSVLRTEKDIERLIKFCQFIIYHQEQQNDLRKALAKICRQFDNAEKEVNAKTLAKYLFTKRKIQYASCDFDNPELENIHTIINNKVGSPIGLLALYILVAHLLGFEVKGGYLNGNIFACTDNEIVEFSDLGNIVTIENFYEKHKLQNDRFLITIDTIILKILQQLFVTYENKKHWQKRRQILHFMNDYELYLEQLNIVPQKIVHSQVLFHVGQVITHKKYGYRGVIVDLDLQPNNTKPDIYLGSQPWYSILVHNSYQNTYIPQNNLMLDISPKPVNNPLMDYFFDEFNNGVYSRNSRVWKTN